MNQIIRLVLHIETILNSVDGSVIRWQFSAIESFELNHDQLPGLRGLVSKLCLPSR